MPTPSPLADYVDDARLRRLFAEALAEDLGAARRDITGQHFASAEHEATAAVVAREHGVVAGLAAVPVLMAVHDAGAVWSPSAVDGDRIEPGTAAGEVRGPSHAVVEVERTLLNLLTHLSGVASLTRRFVDAVEGTRARIYDTRKTLPGLRGLQKYAVACGGGHNHRMGLHDAVLVKDNHLAGIDPASLTAWLTERVAAARAADPPPAFIEVEVDTIEQFERVIAVPGVDIVLLDNMTPAAMREAVAVRDTRAPHLELEASGGVTLDTVRAAAETGVDRIAIGALTHSAPSLDLGLDAR